MKTLKNIITIVAIVAAIAFAYYGYLGGFSKVTITKKTFDSTEIIFTTYQGPYENMKEPWEKFSADIKVAGLEKCDSIGIYLDAPNTPPEKLRSILACKTAGLSDEVKQNLKTKFTTFTLPQADAFFTTFPYNSEFSFFIAPSRVYPEFEKLIADNTIRPSVAIEAYGYDEGRTEILFYMPSSMQSTDYQPLFDAFLAQ